MQRTEKYSIAFFGDTKDENGLPKPFHLYEIFIDEIETFFISSIVTLFDAPLPDTIHYSVQSSDPKDVYNKALNALKSLPDNSNLKIESSWPNYSN